MGLLGAGVGAAVGVGDIFAFDGKITKKIESTLGMSFTSSGHGQMGWPMRVYFQMGIPPPVSLTVVVAAGYAAVGYLVEEVVS